VTLQLVWEEYRAVHPDGYSRSRFCELYRVWEGRLSPTMRQAHVAREKLFVDYAGTTIDVVDAATGEAHACQLFSQLSASRATPTPRRRSLRRCPTGSDRIRAPLAFTAVCRRWWYPTI
jgi:transposase